MAKPILQITVFDDKTTKVVDLDPPVIVDTKPPVDTAPPVDTKPPVEPAPLPADPVASFGMPKVKFAPSASNAPYALVHVDPETAVDHVVFANLTSGDVDEAHAEPYATAATLNPGNNEIRIWSVKADKSVSEILSVNITFNVKYDTVVTCTADKLASEFAAKAKPGVMFQVTGSLKGTFKPTKSGTAGKPIGVTGLTVDASGKAVAIDGTGADHVAIYKSKVIKCDNPEGAHAASVLAGDYWYLEDVDVSGAAHAGCGVVEKAVGTVFNRVHANDNGQLGIAYSKARQHLEVDCETARNNAAKKFSAGGESGGGKWARVDMVYSLRRHSHHNVGPGKWEDINNTNTVTRDADIHNNLNRSNPWEGSGDNHEIGLIGGHFRIEGCHIHENEGTVGIGIHETGGGYLLNNTVDTSLEFRRSLRTDGAWDLGKTRVVGGTYGHILISDAFSGGFKTSIWNTFDIGFSGVTFTDPKPVHVKGKSNLTLSEAGMVQK